ncbi:hypothetical protein QBC35DRAFT_489529 [Podospora australis]|uniref:Uncharacterized protein n=1 Tax=Podospora australis TaxID=1536484 RepID=A0AAN6WZV5_9PEZI|nr:hypothetical protein QBC35DRAFT_489529 [Podospora australis]
MASNAMYSSIESTAPRSSSGMASPQRMPSRSRAQSISSDRPSTIAHSLMSPPLTVSPEPGFIAASAASQIVTNDYDSHAESWYDQHGIEPPGEPATVSPAALQLVNSFLDQLLFNFLCVSHSTALSALRPAVSEVLKPKLAKDAINQADEELREYLGGDDEDPSEAKDQTASSPADWDVELVWKRIRLRVMVYSSLGDMEEGEEDYYMEQGHLGTELDGRLSEAVSPAVAIFLTSILEFMGEQALIVAGQAAYHRMRVKYDKDLKEGLRSPTGIADKIIVEELDMERVALDRTLGRLWRSWKKKIRSPGPGTMERLLARSFSGDSMRGAGHLRSSSSTAELMVPATVPEPEADVEVEQETKVSEEQAQQQREQHFIEDLMIAASTPLPLGPNDVEEIEVPGLARNVDDEEFEGDWEILPARPKSMVVLPWRGAPLALLTPTQSRPQTPTATATTRKRSSSLPTPATTPFLSPTRATPVDSVEDLSKDDQKTEETAAPETPEAETITPTQEDTKAVVDTDVKDSAKDVDDDDDDDEVSIEEPRIVRSSRVSILGGRNPSPTTSENGKLSFINTNLPMMSPGIQSARLIEVTSPRSPVVNSQRNSSTASDSSRQPSPSRLSGAGTPPADEPPRRSPDSQSRSRLSVNYAHRSGPNANRFISEGDESAAEYMVSPITPLTPSVTGSSLPVIPESAPKVQQAVESSRQASRSNTPSAAERSRSTTPSQNPAAVTKGTVLPSTSSSPSRPSTATSGTFFIEAMPVLAEGRSTQPKPQTSRSVQASAPAVPERSAGRQAIANTSAQRQPATIGQVSVERSRGGSSSPSELQPGRGQESAASNRSQRGSGSPSSTKIKPVRTSSEEGMQARIDVVRNFEELIQSDQTIQYTLTPENIQSINTQIPPSRSKGSGSPVISVKARKSEDARQNQSTPRSRSSSAVRPSEMAASGPSQRSVGHVSQSSDTHHSLRSYPTSTSKHGGVVPRSTPPVASKPRGNAPQARDARLPRESLAEFAEFIRSTGPSGGGAAPVNASPGSGGMRNPGMMSMTSVTSSRGSMTSNPNRPRLQARDAAVDYKDDNSDLIDFIRRGPPNNAAGPRIPRAVAPFRTTMDSDQMSGAVGGKAIDAQLNESEIRDSQTSMTSSVPPSVQSSVNSRSALLSGNNNTSSNNTFNKPLPGGNDFDMDMPMPKRKTRRVRDPYAIDLSDEDEMMLEEEEFTAKPKRPPPAREESLIDFLNNYPPPPEPATVPFTTTQIQTTKQNKPKKKSSSASLMARLTRRDSGQSGVPGSSHGFKVPQMPTTESRSLSSRASASVNNAGRSFTPIQVMPNNAGSKAAAMMGGGPGPMMNNRPSASSGTGRVPMKKFEPRDAVTIPSRGTSDLADFLKHSGPPPGITMAAPFPEPMSPERRETNSISKVFGRRKKASVS